MLIFISMERFLAPAANSTTSLCEPPLPNALPFVSRNSLPSSTAPISVSTPSLRMPLLHARKALFRRIAAPSRECYDLTFHDLYESPTEHSVPASCGYSLAHHEG